MGYMYVHDTPEITIPQYFISHLKKTQNIIKALPLLYCNKPDCASPVQANAFGVIFPNNNNREKMMAYIKSTVLRHLRAKGHSSLQQVVTRRI